MSKTPKFDNLWTRARLAGRLLGNPAIIQQVEAHRRGYSSEIKWPSQTAQPGPSDSSNPLRTFFRDRLKGPGIWRWDHYFEIYNRHLSRFRGQNVHILEIGIYSGGSLDMWQEYFGPRCQIYGIDIEKSCKAYERDRVNVYIGDQADRGFWKRFRSEVPYLDIAIDDGGHLPEQQVVSLEELLPHLQPGGVYICEDIHEANNSFTSYLHGLARNLNAFNAVENYTDNERRLVCHANSMQSWVNGIHTYPFVSVIERNSLMVSEFVAAKHGTQWEPFLE